MNDLRAETTIATLERDLRVERNRRLVLEEANAKLRDIVQSYQHAEEQGRTRITELETTVADLRRTMCPT